MNRKGDNRIRQLMFSVIAMTMIVALAGLAGYAQAADTAILIQFSTISQVASTVPRNGDINPYGVAQVKNSVGKLKQGHILVSNFNNSSNLQYGHDYRRCGTEWEGQPLLTH